MTSLSLIGPRGSGKTTVGRRLAKLVGMWFCDADELFEEAYGNIKFSGPEEEEEFRRLEARVINDICGGDYQDHVLAVGGGAVAHDKGIKYRESNVRQLKRFGPMFYLIPFPNDLERSAEILTERLEKDNGQRPSLGEPMIATLEKRHPLYLRASNYVIGTGEKRQPEIAKDILRKYGSLFDLERQKIGEVRV